MSTAPRISNREVVGSFSSRSDLRRALALLAEAGFTHSDLSLLASHDSVDAADSEAVSLRNRLHALWGEFTYEGPLVTAGLIAVATGPIGALIAGIIAAGVGGAALKEVMAEVTAQPRAAEFAKALAAGDILLWVNVPDAAREEAAKRCLASADGAHIHLNDRTPA